MENLDSHPRQTSFTAVVAGATGATGRWIVCELVNNPSCTAVIALTRSDIGSPGEVFPSADAEFMKSKLIIQKIDFNLLKQTGEFSESSKPQPQVAFCALGSAPFSEDSDFITPVAFGRACKAAGVESMFLVSAQGAKPGSWIPYSDTIGRREEAFKALNFRRLGIYRSGMMDRQEKTRTNEWIRHILPSCLVLSTKDIARVMVESAIRMKDGVFIFSHSEIKKIAASFHNAPITNLITALVRYGIFRLFSQY